MRQLFAMTSMARNNSGGTNGTSSTSIYGSTPIKFIFLPFYCIFILVIIISNAAVFTAFFQMKRLLKRKIPNILLSSQAVVDFFIGLSTIPRIICLSGGCVEATQNPNRFFNEYTTFLAVGTLIVCTLERFLCVKYPIYHHKHATKEKVIFLLLLTWMISIIPGLIRVYYVTQFETRLWDYYIATAAILFLGVIIVFSLLGATYRSIRKSISEKILTAQSATSDVTNSATSSLIVAEQKKKGKVTRVFLMMSIIYTVTMLPSIVGQLILDGMAAPRRTNFIARRSLFLFYLASSMINPFLTLRFKPDFRNVIQEFYKNHSIGSRGTPITQSESKL